MSVDPSAVARSIVGALVADGPRVDELTGEVVGWITDHPDEVGDYGVAFAAARAVHLGLAELDTGAAAALGDAQLSIFRSMPVAAQVAVSLHHFVRLGIDEIAAATARPVDDVRLLLGFDAEADIAVATTPEPPVPKAKPELEPTPEPNHDPAPTPAPKQKPAPKPKATFGTSPDDDAGLTGAIPPAAQVVVRRRRRTDSKRRKSSRPRVWVIVVVVVLALIAVGIVARNLRDDSPSSAASVDSGVADSAAVTREQLSPGCASADGDIELAAQNVSVNVGDIERTYRIVAPAAVGPGIPRTLVVDFGDLGQTVDAHLAETRFDGLASALKLVVTTVSPFGDFAQWNVNDDDDDPPDMALVERIIDQETKRLCIDQTRIVLAGRGAGAHFAAAFACRHPGLVSGLILVAGVYRPEGCSTPPRLSILAVVGAKDDVYPLSGSTGAGFRALVDAGGGLRGGSTYEPKAVQGTLDDWAESMDCVGTATQQFGLVSMRISTSCDTAGEVWRSVIDADHQWFPVTYDLIVQFLTTPGPFPPA